LLSGGLEPPHIGRWWRPNRRRLLKCPSSCRADGGLELFFGQAPSLTSAARGALALEKGLQAMSKRRTHSPEFKGPESPWRRSSGPQARSRRFAVDHAIHPIQVKQWKSRCGGRQRFCSPEARRATPTRKYRAKGGGAVSSRSGRLQIGLECAKKKSQAAVYARETAQTGRHESPLRFKASPGMLSCWGCTIHRSTTGPHTRCP